MHMHQWMSAKLVFQYQFAQLHTNGFQEFFQKLMQYRYPSFLPVRTHGSLGDQGADGLFVDGHKLYACYGPYSPNAANTIGKFKKDLASALRQRPGQFSTFVFVHNDRQGMHPWIATAIVWAKSEHPETAFEHMGFEAIWREFRRLDQPEVEDMLGQAIQVEALVYGIGLTELAPLLSHLGRTRVERPQVVPRTIPLPKIEFNEFGQDVREAILRGYRFVRHVDEYYELYKDGLARDETAAGFREQYLALRSTGKLPDEIFQGLIEYIVGNRMADIATLVSAATIISYFFQACDIFEEPTAGFMAAWEARI